jgi:large subunit ribosomal protein L13
MTNIERKTTSFDATDRAPGRLASEIARALMGKTSTAYQPNVDAGDFVVVKNAAKMKWTGKKMDQKVYHHHTAHPGGLRTKSLKTMWGEDPAEVLRMAVSRMLPKNKHRTPRMIRLTVE